MKRIYLLGIVILVAALITGAFVWFWPQQTIPSFVTVKADQITRIKYVLWDMSSEKSPNYEKPRDWIYILNDAEKTKLLQLLYNSTKSKLAVEQYKFQVGSSVTAYFMDGTEEKVAWSFTPDHYGDSGQLYFDSLGNDNQTKYFDAPEMVTWVFENLRFKGAPEAFRRKYKNM